jgi:hypothetical protein
MPFGILLLRPMPGRSVAVVKEAVQRQNGLSIGRRRVAEYLSAYLAPADRHFELFRFDHFSQLFFVYFSFFFKLKN